MNEFKGSTQLVGHFIAWQGLVLASQGDDEVQFSDGTRLSRHGHVLCVVLPLRAEGDSRLVLSTGLNPNLAGIRYRRLGSFQISCGTEPIPGRSGKLILPEGSKTWAERGVFRAQMQHKGLLVIKRNPIRHRS